MKEGLKYAHPQALPSCSTPESMASSDHDDYCLDQYHYGYQRNLLAGKVAVVTGGGSGIGFRIAELFMRHGCDTVIASRKLDKLQEVTFALCV